MGKCEWEIVCVSGRVCVCLNWRERECVCEWERGRVCVCVSGRERESVCV